MTCLISISPSFLRRLTLLLLRLHFLSFFFQSCPLCIFISIKYVSLMFFFFPESLLNTDTRIIRAVWHVPLVSLSTGFHCNTFSERSAAVITFASSISVHSFFSRGQGSSPGKLLNSFQAFLSQLEVCVSNCDDLEI